MSASALSKVISGKASVSPEMAVLLEAGLVLRRVSDYPCRPPAICTRRVQLRAFQAYICTRACWLLLQRNGRANNSCN
ncbi:hypothetical protein [Pantoea sp. SGAir0175]